MKQNEKVAKTVRAYFDGVQITEEFKDRLMSLQAEQTADAARSSEASMRTEREGPTREVFVGRRPFAALAAALALVVAVAAAVVFLPKLGSSAGLLPETTAKQEMIERHLTALHVENAQYEGEHSYGEYRESASKERLTVYRDPQTNVQYLFDRDTGTLRHVFGNTTEADREAAETKTDVDRAQLEQTAQSYAAQMIAPISAGELRLTERTMLPSISGYYWQEYSGELPTGTRVFVQLLNDGKLFGAVIKRGTVLEHLDPELLIGEEAALEAANRIMQQDPPDKDYRVDRTTCALEAVGDEIYYVVWFYGRTSRYEENYYAHIDAITGDVIMKTWNYD